MNEHRKSSPCCNAPMYRLKEGVICHECKQVVKPEDRHQILKCKDGACHVCHDGVNEDNPTGQRGECPNVIKDKNQEYERDHSHVHCWDQEGGFPACGESLNEHKQCCLCDTPIPESFTVPKPDFLKDNLLEDWEQEFKDGCFRGYSSKQKIFLIPFIKKLIKYSYQKGREDEKKERCNLCGKYHPTVEHFQV